MKSFKPVIALAHTPPYKIHRYFARRPWNVFKQLIEIFSNDNEIILDPFCGGGVTIYEGLKLHRKVIGYDLNPLSIFIIKNMIEKSVEIEVLNKYYEIIQNYLTYLYNETDNIFTQTDKNVFGESPQVPVEWEELTYIIECPFCLSKIPLSNENKIANGIYSCGNLKCKGNRSCGGSVTTANNKRKGYEYIFSAIKSNASSKYTKIETNPSRLKTISDHILFLDTECKKNNIEIESDSIPLNWDRQFEDLLSRKGVNTFQDLFTKRNLLINTLLLRFIKNLVINENSEYIKSLFRLVFSSSLRDTNVMSFTNPGWQSGKPTTWSKHAYWTPSQFCEVNVRIAFKNAYKRMLNSILFNKQFDYSICYGKKIEDISTNSNIYLSSSSIDEDEFPENSVDTIITDPPYGSNVQYLELSHFWYPWNKDLYDSQPNFFKEAVANRKNNFSGSKNFFDYERNLYNVFRKCYSVLKPKKYMVMTFNNKDIRAWLALLISIFRSGFIYVEDGLIYQGGVVNYKQTSHTKSKGSPYGDFIHIFQKPEISNLTSDYYYDFKDFISNLDVIFSKYLYEMSKKNGENYRLLTKMFTEAIPVIQKYVNSLSFEHTNTEIYSLFNKDYLSGFHIDE